MARRDDHAAELIDVRGAADVVRRHPETVRRWVWSGRLPARRQGNRLLIVRGDVEAIAAREGGASVSLAAWADRLRAAREGGAGSGTSAADLVIEDRVKRSRPAEARAGR